MRRLQQQGHAVTAVCPEGPYCRRFSEYGIACRTIALDRSSMNPFREIATIWRLARLFRELAPDIVHSFMMKPNIYGTIAARAANVRFTVASVTGLGSFYIDAPRSMKGRIFHWGLNKFYASALHLANAAIFYNPDDLATFVDLHIARPATSFLIPGSGVDTAYYSASAEGIAVRTKNSHPITITMIARLIRDKGTDEFLSAAEMLKKKFGNTVRLLLVGAPDPGNPKAVDSSKISKLKDAGIIEQPGFQENIRGLLSETDIYTLPSYREGLPVSVLEAMSMGLPVVTTDAPGCREAVQEGVNGRLVPVADAPALAEALEALIRNPELRRQMGAAGRQRALECFSTDKVVAAHLQLYERLLK